MSGDANNSESLFISHTRLREDFEAHREQMLAHLEESTAHRKAVSEDSAQFLEALKEVNKTANSALALAETNVRATAGLVEALTTIASIKKFLKWSGSGVLVMAGAVFLTDTALEILSKYLGF